MWEQYRRDDYGSLHVHTIFLCVSLRKSHKVIRKTALARTDFIGRRISVSFKTVVKQRRIAVAAPRSNAYMRGAMRALSQLTYPFVIFRPSRRDPGECTSSVSPIVSICHASARIIRVPFDTPLRLI